MFESDVTYIGLEANRGMYNVLVQPPVTAQEQRELVKTGVCDVAGVATVDGTSRVTIDCQELDAETAAKQLDSSAVQVAQTLSLLRGTEVLFNPDVHVVVQQSHLAETV